MTPSPFLLQLAILLLPGVIWAHLDARYASKLRLTDTAFLLRAAIFGLASYAATWVVYSAFGQPFQIVDLAAAATTNVLTGELAIQIGVATVVGVLLSVLWMYAVTYKWMSKLLRRIRATNTYGDEDVWNFALNSSDPASEYVNVRDFENKITYAGYVRIFSETDKIRELVLSDVRVFSFDGDLLFESPRIYIARRLEGIHLEFPYQGKGQK